MYIISVHEWYSSRLTWLPATNFQAKIVIFAKFKKSFHLGKAICLVTMATMVPIIGIYKVLSCMGKVCQKLQVQEEKPGKK